MKEILSKVKSFSTFDLPLRYDYISTHFASTHNNFQKQFPHWSLAATRKKIIANYWFRKVLFHYTAIVAIAIIGTMPFGVNWNLLSLSIFSAGLISLIILTAFNYWPMYYSDFLPKLDTIIAEQEKQIEAEEEIKKCKRTQFLIPALTIIFYVFSKTSNIPLLPSNDHSAELLNKLYGVSKDKLKKNLSRLYKLSSLSPKERAEIQKGINIARTFFEVLECPLAEQVLDQLDLKLQRL